MRTQAPPEAPPATRPAVATIRELAGLVLRAADRLKASRLPEHPPWRLRVGLDDGQLREIEAFLEFSAAQYKTTDERTLPCLQMTVAVIKRAFRRTAIWIDDGSRRPRPKWFPGHPRREKTLRIAHAIATLGLPRERLRVTVEAQLAVLMLREELRRRPPCQELLASRKTKGRRRDWEVIRRAMFSGSDHRLWMSEVGIKEICQTYFVPPSDMLASYTVPPALREEAALRVGWLLATNLFLHHRTTREFIHYLALTQRSILRDLVREHKLEPVMAEHPRQTDASPVESLRDPRPWDDDATTEAYRPAGSPATVRLAAVLHGDPVLRKRAYEAARRGLLQRVDDRTRRGARVEVDAASFASWETMQEVRATRRRAREVLLPLLRSLGRRAPEVWIRRTAAALRRDPHRTISRLRRSFEVEGLSETNQREFLDHLAEVACSLRTEPRLRLR